MCQSGTRTESEITYLVEGLSAQLLLFDDQVQRKCQQNESVANVTEHDGEQEREGHHAEHGCSDR
jgi:hypothetical protein